MLKKGVNWWNQDRASQLDSMTLLLVSTALNRGKLLAFTPNSGAVFAVQASFSILCVHDIASVATSR